MMFPHALRRSLPAVVAAAALSLVVVAPASAAPTPTPSPTGTSAPGSGVSPGVTKLQVPAVTPTPLGDQQVIAALRPRDTALFTMAGVTWAPGPATPTVQVRTRADGSWSEWSTLAAETLTSNDPGTRPGTAPAYTGPATGLEVRVLITPGGAAPADLQLSLIDPKQLATDAAPAATRPAASSRALPSTQAPQPPVISRKAWGADESLKAKSGADCMQPKYDSTIKAVVVHHTEGSNSYTKEQSASIVRGIYAYHVTGNGWCDIGYNFLIDRYGQTFEGRSGGITKPVHGAHAYDWNTNTMGLSIMGNFMAQLPPEPALDAAVRLTAWRLSAYYRQATGQLAIGRYTSDVISGHRQVSDTDCPGDAFFTYLPTFRTRVAAALGNHQTPIWKKWQALGGVATTGDVHEGEQPYLGGRITRLSTHTLYQRPDGGVHWISGPMLKKYEEMGEAASTLGFPTTDPNCSASGCWQAFDRGFILWSPRSGAHPNWGAIRDGYGALGFEGGELGYPTTDEVCNATGCHQGYERGFLLYSPRTGTHVSRGQLRDKFAAEGYERGWLGYPTTGDGCDKTGCWQDYQGGSLASSRDRGTRFIRGTVRDRYRSMGGRTGLLGYPSTDEICGLRDGGCVQLFGDKAIYWSYPTGAWANLGAIRQVYAAEGFERGRLGYPTSGEACDRVGCVQRFQGGTITHRWGGSTTVS